MNDSTGASQRHRRRARAISIAAQELAAEHGFAGFTLDRLAERCGVSRRTLLNHVASKEDAVLGELPQLDDATLAQLRDGGPTGDLLDDLTQVITGALVADAEGADPAADWQRLQAVLLSNPQLLPRVHERLETLIDQLVAHLVARPGVDDSTARLAVHVVGGAVEHAVRRCIDDPSGPALADRIDHNLRTIRRMAARG